MGRSDLGGENAAAAFRMAVDCNIQALATRRPLIYFPRY